MSAEAILSADGFWDKRIFSDEDLPLDACKGVSFSVTLRLLRVSISAFIIARSAL